MKNLLLTLFTAALIFWAAPLRAECSGINAELMPNSEVPIVTKEVLDHLFDGDAYFSEAEGKYHVCFKYPDPYDTFDSPLTPIEFNIPSSVTSDIILEGMHLDGSSVGAGNFPLVITHNGSGRLIIKDMEIGKSTFGGNGLKILKPSSPDAGIVEIDNLYVAGRSQAQKSEICLDVAAENTLIKNSQIKYCTDAVMVRGSGVRFEDSLLDTVTRGVHVAEGVRPVFVSKVQFKSVGSSNDRKSWIVYDGTGPGVLAIEKRVVDNVRQLFAVTPEPPTVGSYIEFYTFSGLPCGEGTPCNYFEDSTFPITGEIEAAGSATFMVREYMIGMALIGIYTSPTLGSSVASNYLDDRSPIVAFVQTPYDIPTSPETQDEAAVDDAGTSAAGADADGDGGFSAAGGCKMSIASATRTSVILAPWWIVLMLASMVPARAVMRNRKK